MTNAPTELLDFRTTIMNTTGLTNPVEVGISGDSNHPKGYHRGVADIVAAGNYPDNDYSTLQVRDRVGGNDASAVDIGDDWPNGGRAAWLRFNNSLIDELYHHPERLPNLRAMNFSRDGVEQKRYDTNIPGAGIVNSTDTVTIHTHLEFWRNKSGRTETLARIIVHMSHAVSNTPIDALAVVSHLENDMIFTVTGVPANATDVAGVAIPNNAQCLVTPHGLFNLQGSEFFSLPAADQATRITMTYVRALVLVNAWRQDPLDTATLAQQIAAQFPQDDVTAATIVAALQSEEGAAALVAAAQYAEDH